MGYPFDVLVPPAILLYNPGISKEEFAERLDRTESTGTASSTYHQGLPGLAGILQLEHSAAFKELMRKKRDKDFGYIVEDFWNLLGGLRVIKRRHEDLGEQVVTVENYTKREVGEDIGIEDHKVRLDRRGKILEVISRSDNPTVEEGEPTTFPKQTFRLRLYNLFTEEDEFESVDELVAKYPHYDPNVMFNWAQEGGRFRTLISDGIGWVQRNGHYFLDEAFTKNNLTVGEHRLIDCYAWNDLILTAEAVRTEFWKVLARRGLEHMPEFLEKHPEVVKAYERSTWDSHTSLYAKLNGMTHTELLRFRLLAKVR